LTVILVVEMCVLVTVVEPAVVTSKEIRRTEVHTMESLQAEGAMVDRQWVVVVVEEMSKW
jgi:hypothetical protein